MPKSSPHNAGNINLRGKKCKTLRCGCCEVYDLRGDYETTRVEREELKVATVRDGHDASSINRYYLDPDEDTLDDKGDWEVYRDGNGKIGIASSDFAHDVVLYLSGDFGTHHDRIEYLTRIARRLNRTFPL